MSALKELFGGAITVTLPSTLIDASAFRQIPDTQEVFVSADSDISFVIDILQRVQPDDPAEAARFHFDSLAHDNDAVSSVVKSIDSSEVEPPTSLGDGATPPPIMLYGTQQVQKFNRTVPDDVHILVAVYRIPGKNIDLVLSANLPEKTEFKTGLTPQQLQDGKDAFAVAARSLKIVNFGLFA